MARMVLVFVVSYELGYNVKLCLILSIPFRINSTPDQRVGSPGVRDMKTPCGQACLRLELLQKTISFIYRIEKFETYNSTSKCCFRTAERVERRCDTMLFVRRASVECEWS
jgi:hypothetical protein